MILIFDVYVETRSSIQGVGEGAGKRLVRPREVRGSPMEKTSTCQNDPQVLTTLSFKFK